MNPPVQSQEFWGKMTIDAKLVCLVKGIGKVDYVPGSLNPDGSEPKPVTAVKMTLSALPEMNLQYPDLIREPIAQGWGEWGEITLPSIRDCGITQLTDLNGKWVKLELAPTGRKYTNQAGEQKDATCFKLVQVFADEATCRGNFQATRKGGTPAAQQTPPWTAPADATPASNGNKERETALKFLPTYVVNAVRASGKDLEKARAALAPMLAGQPLLAKHFTVDSQEVVDLMVAELAK
jgi:hypothetical protein